MAKHTIADPHDRFFKAAMQHSEVAKAFFQHYLPLKIARQLDYDSLRLQSESYLGEELNASFSDLVFECRIAGTSSVLSVLIEHQSRPDQFMPFRVLHYWVSLLHRKLKASPGQLLPGAFAMVFYHGQVSPYPHSLYLRDCFDDPSGLVERQFTEPLHLLDVNQIDDEELRRQAWVGPMAAALKHIRDQDIAPLLPRLAMEINALEGDHASMLGYLRTLLYYLVHAGNVRNPESLAEQLPALPDSVRGEVMTIAEQLKALGRNEGREEGREEGRVQALREIACKMLGEGAAPEFVAKVTGLSMDNVQALLKQPRSK